MREAFEKETKRKEREYKFIAQMANGTNKRGSSAENSDEERKSDSSEGEYDYSSGIESVDDDAELLLEQEEINAARHRLLAKAQEKHEEP